MNEYILIIALPAGNYEDNSTMVPKARVVASVIQYFVRERRHIHHHTVAKDIMDFMEGMGFIKVDRDYQKYVNAALRLVQQLLNCLGLK